MGIAAALSLPLFPRAHAVPSGSATPTAPSRDADDHFPCPDSIRPNVGFWIRVFAEWSSSQVAIHDSAFPGIVYEVVRLPGEIADNYTAEQQQFVASARALWRERLIQLHAKVARGEPLDPDEAERARLMAEQGGRDGLSTAHERVRAQRGLRERFRAGIERSARYDARIREVLRATGLPGDLAFLPHVESSFRPDARSSAGAVGLWQLTSAAARKSLVVEAAIDERLDPIAATHGAAAYLRKAHDLLGSWPLAVTSYNHGVPGMQRARRMFGTDFDLIYREYKGSQFAFASRNFYAEFLAARQVARSPKTYFPEGLSPQPVLDLDRLVLPEATTAERIARQHGLSLEQLWDLNRAFTRPARPSLPLSKGMGIWLPRGSLAGKASRDVAATAAGTVPAQGRRSYLVEHGDTLSGVARRHGIDVATLRRINGIPPNSSLIHAGQELDLHPLPVPAATRRHVVRRGDTLLRIAAFYEVGLLDLLSANQILIDAIIHPGQAISIPGAR